MNFYGWLAQNYEQFLSLFPPAVQWLVTLLIVVGLGWALTRLVRHNILFIIVVIILIPFLIPIVVHLLNDIYNFCLRILQALHLPSRDLPNTG